MPIGGTYYIPKNIMYSVYTNKIYTVLKVWFYNQTT